MAQLLVILSACVAFGEVEHSVYVRDEASGEGLSNGCTAFTLACIKYYSAIVMSKHIN